MNIPSQLSKVTWFSKLVALTMFVFLPFIGFFVGINYQNLLNDIENQYKTPLKCETTKKVPPIQNDETISNEPEKIDNRPTYSDEGVVTYNLSALSITAPIKYKIQGNKDNFTIEYNNDMVDHFNGIQRDFSQLHFRVLPLVGTLSEFANKSFIEHQKYDELNEGGEVFAVSYGNLNGYAYNCPFITSQKCIFLPIENSDKLYLSIAKLYSDPNNFGYDKELEDILSTIVISN
jgi:hypothetical protein